MNTKTRFIEAVEMLNCIIVTIVMLGAFRIVLGGVGENYQMIFGSVPMTDAAIDQILRSLEIAVPMVICGWAFYAVVMIWCRAQEKLEEERV